MNNPIAIRYQDSTGRNFTRTFQTIPAAEQFLADRSGRNPIIVTDTSNPYPFRIRSAR